MPWAEHTICVVVRVWIDSRQVIKKGKCKNELSYHPYIVDHNEKAGAIFPQKAAVSKPERSEFSLTNVLVTERPLYPARFRQERDMALWLLLSAGLLTLAVGAKKIAP